MGKRTFTLVFPYYENPGMLDRQLAHLAALPEDLRQHLALIVVDDGSPDHPLGEFTAAVMQQLGLAGAQLFRITVDVRWNWIAARNLAVAQAQTDWVLLTDIDHLVPEATVRRIVERKLSDRCVYRFSRKDLPDLTDYKPHPNSWLMTRAMFDQIGGYDERFSGYYGTDGEFRDRVRANAKDVVMLEEHLVRVPREVVPDASTTRYERKQPEDREGVGRIRAEIAKSPRPHRGLFPWVRITT